MKYLSVNINPLEKKRFTEDILEHDCEFYFHEEFKSVFTRCKFKQAKTVFIWGRRPPDISAFKLAVKTVENIVIMQHAKNPRREVVPISYFFTNFKKVCKWLVSMGRLKVGRPMARKGDSPRILVFYFTDAYRDEWQSHTHGLQDVSFIKCEPPRVNKYGVVIEPDISLESVNCFYVDEPLTTTLGISEAEERQLILSLARKIEGPILVKLHPRSCVSKFNGLSQFQVVDAIYQHARIIAGYNSALLDFNFSAKLMFKLQSSGEWLEEPRVKTNQNGDYVTQIKEHLNDYDL
ncbi:hypothetical protein PULV_a2617 [Pseudoalteromonas ulvae UL12]|uniref:hypothetical protein n=1 Tax=Pseudoalteromonas ulvae TaxID=107327 RepID=UPI00186B727F|nr:hypothetical protein [Pseudoalteromonas ulvae]MBE0364312.1 hypothetical protein [Pseudoalteromonas ulvae UL12]